MDDLLRTVADIANNHIDGLGDRPVVFTDPVEIRSELPDGPIDPLVVIDQLTSDAQPGLVGSPGPRYFGFVTGGALPAALAADWLVSAWDQNAFSHVSSPAAASIEAVAAAWILELLDLPRTAGVGFVTGCQMAHVTALAAARHRVMDDVGWPIPERGLAGGPPIRVITGAMRHSTVDRALRLLGIGSEAMGIVATDELGRLRIDALEATLAESDGPTIVIAQAGEVNTGSFDPIDEIADVIDGSDAWLHVDGAFGLWVRASASHRHLATGAERADSWAFDAHKWLNVPYDCGVAAVADVEAHIASMSYTGDYLVATSDRRDAIDWGPDASRRARGVPVYAAIRSLGRSGVAGIVDRCCRLAARFAAGLDRVRGAELIADPIINQVLFRFEDDERTAEILRRVQSSGVAWMGPTRWDDRAAIRMSVSNWSTTEADIEMTIEAFVAATSA